MKTVTLEEFSTKIIQEEELEFKGIKLVQDSESISKEKHGSIHVSDHLVNYLKKRYKRNTEDRHYDFSQSDFSWLKGILRFRYLNAENTNFDHVNLSVDYDDFTFFEICNLKNTSFQNSILMRCYFNGSDLSNANFSNSNLTDARFGIFKISRIERKRTTLTNVNFGDANIIGAHFTGADLRGANLENIYYKLGFYFTGSTIFKNAIYNDDTKFPKNAPRRKKRNGSIVFYKKRKKNLSETWFVDEMKKVMIREN